MAPARGPCVSLLAAALLSALWCCRPAASLAAGCAAEPHSAADDSAQQCLLAAESDEPSLLQRERRDSPRPVAVGSRQPLRGDAGAEAPWWEGRSLDAAAPAESAPLPAHGAGKRGARVGPAADERPARGVGLPAGADASNGSLVHAVPQRAGAAVGVVSSVGVTGVDRPTDLEDLLISPPVASDWQARQELWRTITQSRRRYWSQHRDPGIGRFFKAALFYEWLLFFGFLALFVLAQSWPRACRAAAPADAGGLRRNLTALAVWILLGVLYNLAVALIRGPKDGIAWTSGYLLQFLMGFDNVFVFQVIVQAFRLPRKVMGKVLCIMVVAQVAQEMCFYMGLAQTLKSAEPLQYALGVSLLYAGYALCRPGAEDAEDAPELAGAEQRESWTLSFFRFCLGDRLSKASGSEEDTVFLVEDDKVRLSLVGLMTACLLVANFVLDVDVTLAKIEQLEPAQQYVSFSSSAVAAFAMPNVYFIARQAFDTFDGLRLGLAVVLLWTGAQMMLHRLGTVAPMLEVAIIFGVVALSVLVSLLMGRVRSPPSADDLASLDVKEDDGEREEAADAPEPRPDAGRA